MEHENLNNQEATQLDIGAVSDSLNNILKTVKKKSKNKRWMGANVHISAFEEGKECVLNILEDIFKKLSLTAGYICSTRCRNFKI